MPDRDVVIQLIVNGVATGLEFGLVGLGLLLCYRVYHFFNFAHGAMFTVGAYATLLGTRLGLPLPVASVTGIIATGLMGIGTERLVFRPLRHRTASPLVFLLASLGLYVVLQNILALCFGNDTHMLHDSAIQGSRDFLGARVTPVQEMTIVAGGILGAVLFAFLRCTRMGKTMRALSCDSTLAAISGVNVDRLFAVTLAISSSLAASAAVLVALQSGMLPTMGIEALIMGVVVVVVAGHGSVAGILLTGVMLGLAKHGAAWIIGAGWQDTAIFVVLLVVLAIRPRGCFGERTENATV